MDNFSPSTSSPESISGSALPEENQPSDVWRKVREVLARELSDRSYKTWFEPLTCKQLTDDKLVLSVPDNYYGQWLKNHYHDLLMSAIHECLGSKREVIYEVAEKEAPKEQAPAPAPREQADSLSPSLKDDSAERSPNSAVSPSKQNTSAATQSELNKNYSFDQFVIGPGNRFAHAAAMAVAEAPARQYNPLFIYGPVGLGKTHLMQAIAHEIKRRNPGAKVLYISSEKFTNQLITSIQTRSTAQFRSKYRNLDLLLIDDIHFIAEKEATQEEFFHTFNSLYDSHKQIVVSSDRPPKEIPGLEARLVSRFGWGLVTDIQTPDFETRVAILKKKMEKETVQVPDDVAYYIASKIASNIRELEGALIRVVAYCSLTGQLVTKANAQQVLRDSVKEEEKNLSIEKIQGTVAEYFNLKVSELRSKRRSRSVSRPRQIAMYLVRSLTDHSLPEIGEYFGGRDHSTVLHGFNKISDELETKPDTQRLVEELRELLKKGR